MSESVDYNKLFAELQKDCDLKNCDNAFACITLEELIELNYLLDRLLIFCENIDTEELENYECGDKIIHLYELADTLFLKSMKDSYEKTAAKLFNENTKKSKYRNIDNFVIQ